MKGGFSNGRRSATGDATRDAQADWGTSLLSRTLVKAPQLLELG